MFLVAVCCTVLTKEDQAQNQDAQRAAHELVISGPRSKKKYKKTPPGWRRFYEWISTFATILQLTTLRNSSDGNNINPQAIKTPVN